MIGLYVDANNEVQHGKNENGFPGVKRQWLRYTNEAGKRLKYHLDVTATDFELNVPDLEQVYKLELMVTIIHLLNTVYYILKYYIL